MSLSEYQKIHSAWLVICFIFLDGFLEYEYIMYQLIISMYPISSGVIQHPAMYPIEWLPYLIIIWLVGHVIIWAINKFR